MPPGRTPGRFFLRASGLLILMLVMWWFFLLQPMLFLLRASAETCGSVVFGGDSHELVTVTASGDWSFLVPLDLVVRDLNGQPGAAQVHSIDFRHSQIGRNRIHLRAAGILGDYPGRAGHSPQLAAAALRDPADGDSGNCPAPGFR